MIKILCQLTLIAFAPLIVGLWLAVWLLDAAMTLLLIVCTGGLALPFLLLCRRR